MTIIITELRNAVSLNQENTAFDVEINHPEYGWIPYTLEPDDTDETINNDNLFSLIGSNYAPYVEHVQQISAEAVRHERDDRLSKSVDPIVSNPLRWADMSSSQQNVWSQYRTDLLNVPQQAGFPANVTWPTPPE